MGMDINSYYKNYYNKETKISSLRIIIIKGNEKIYKESIRFRSENIKSSFEMALQIVLKRTNYLKINRFSNEDNTYIIRISNDILYNKLKFKDLDYFSGSKLYTVKEMLDSNRDLIIKKESDEFTFINAIKKKECSKGFITRTNRNNNYNVSKDKIDTLLKKGYTSIVFWDSEMNCITDKRESKVINEVISIGAVKYNLLTGNTKSWYNTIRPTLEPILSEKCISITGLKQHDIDKSKTLDEVLVEFEKWIGKDKTLYCSWGNDDLRALKNEQICKNLNNSLINTIVNNYIDFQEEFSRDYLKSKNRVSLMNAVKIFRTEFYGDQHNALDDAKNLFIIYRNYKKKI